MGVPVSAPVIVCLCGCTRFKDAYEKANREETLAGRIVLTVGFFGHQEAPPRFVDTCQCRDDGGMGAGQVVCWSCAVRQKNTKALEDRRISDAWWARFEAEVKPKLDDLHLRKIDMADEVLVLNVGGYIGESTRREIGYAKAIGKHVRYLEANQ